MQPTPVKLPAMGSSGRKSGQSTFGSSRLMRGLIFRLFALIVAAVVEEIGDLVFKQVRPQAPSSDCLSITSSDDLGRPVLCFILNDWKRRRDSKIFRPTVVRGPTRQP
ncbi:unnamed protein product [Soboliphyme baturini]|uniref:Secreted protein n=1 Tax=Soboliphyme baturini TaxID=241478 RepID=A0A183IAS1_9BILA|nr:unnamed protein product [Soboliphyme baturini]